MNVILRVRVPPCLPKNKRIENMHFKKTLVIAAALVTLTSGCVVSQTPAPCGDYAEIPFQDKTLCVSRDYYSVNDIRTPVGMSEALSIAKANNAQLPTKSMVDAIWHQSDCQLRPIPMKPVPAMTQTWYFKEHNRLIEEQLIDIDKTACNIIAGHKKDIIEPERKGKVTIYGWHRLNGRPIQPVYSGHSAEYRDYSHGLRLVRILE